MIRYSQSSFRRKFVSYFYRLLDFQWNAPQLSIFHGGSSHRNRILTDDKPRRLILIFTHFELTHVLILECSGRVRRIVAVYLDRCGQIPKNQ